MLPFTKTLFKQQNFKLNSILKFNFCESQQQTSSVLKQSEANYQEKNFVDKYRFKVQAGKGGNGCITFYRDRRVTTGAPDGGDGGNGGSIVFQATDYFKDFRIYSSKTIVGNDGKNGGKVGRNGKDAKDVHISIPVGTLLYEVIEEKRVPVDNQLELNPRKKREYYQKFLVDLDTIGQQYVVAKGGKGGFGNKRHRNMQPGQQYGKPGQQKTIFMELKSIADVGLVGYPNVGKSTFLSAVSRSLPKIANYPFTTLAPTVGKIKFIDNYMFTLADIPGIIEDSHKNKGLGLEFLRHIERTDVLAFVLDSSSDISLEHQLKVLRTELLLYKPDFLEKKGCVVCSKTDLIDEQQFEENFKKLQQQTEYKCFQISSKHGVGLGDVIVHLRDLVEEARKHKKDSTIDSEDFLNQQRKYQEWEY